MCSLEDKYEQLKQDYESYQEMAEAVMQKQSKKIVELDRKLDMMSLVVDISEYINKSLGSSDIESMINDIMIGILGVTYSSVYLIEDKKLKLKSSNLLSTNHHFIIEKYNNDRSYNLEINLVNSPFDISEEKSLEIHSAIFMPIYFKKKMLGVIIVEHNKYNYLGKEHIKLLTTLSNQIAICIENNRLYNKIKENSQRDFLTSLYNRRYFFSIIDEKIKNKEKNFSIAMIDIDNFKKCNDTYGHQYGDLVLRRVSKIIKNKISKKGIVARYGGEELIIYVSQVYNIIDIYNIMENIRNLIENTVFQCGKIKNSITISIGIALSQEDDKCLEDIIYRADINLYKAKSLGKNRVVY